MLLIIVSIIFLVKNTKCTNKITYIRQSLCDFFLCFSTAKKIAFQNLRLTELRIDFIDMAVTFYWQT